MNRNAMKYILCLAFAAITMISCRIEPPLNLPTEDVVIENPIVIQELEVIWNIDVSWRANWVYDWDQEDSLNWGPIGYPEPTRYDVMRYFLGAEMNVPHTRPEDDFIINTNWFQRRFNFGYYDILVYSLIDSPDQIQSVVIDKSNYDEVVAYTHTRGVRMYRPKAGPVTVQIYNQPEIFYSALEKNVHITHDPADYDYYDEENHVWVKKLEAVLNPLVYIYLVQVILHNNQGRISTVSSACAIDGLADKTSVTYGNTSENDVSVQFDMRLKKDLNPKKFAKPGETSVDVIGGKLTTFGLCGMPPWAITRASSRYEGTRANVNNNFALNLRFKNECDSTYYYDVTKQMQEQSHGGVITIEIDVDTLKKPVSPTPPTSGSGFDPYVEDYKEEVHSFDM